MDVHGKLSSPILLYAVIYIPCNGVWGGDSGSRTYLGYPNLQLFNPLCKMAMVQGSHILLCTLNYLYIIYNTKFNAHATVAVILCCLRNNVKK